MTSLLDDLRKALSRIPQDEALKAKFRSCKACHFFKNGYCTQVQPPSKILNVYEAQLCSYYSPETVTTGEITRTERESQASQIDLLKKVNLIDLITKISEITTLKTLETLSEVTNIKNIESLDMIDLITTISTVSAITNIVNVQSVDLIDLITTVSSITNIANVDSIDLIDNITNLGTLNLLNTVNLIKSISSIDSITNIANIDSVDLIDRITLIDEITKIGEITNIHSINSASAYLQPIRNYAFASGDFSGWHNMDAAKITLENDIEFGKKVKFDSAAGYLISRFAVDSNRFNKVVFWAYKPVSGGADIVCKIYYHDGTSTSYYPTLTNSWAKYQKTPDANKTIDSIQFTDTNGICYLAYPMLIQGTTVTQASAERTLPHLTETDLRPKFALGVNPNQSVVAVPDGYKAIIYGYNIANKDDTNVGYYVLYVDSVSYPLFAGKIPSECPALKTYVHPIECSNGKDVKIDIGSSTDTDVIVLAQVVPV